MLMTSKIQRVFVGDTRKKGLGSIGDGEMIRALEQSGQNPAMSVASYNPLTEFGTLIKDITDPWLQYKKLQMETSKGSYPTDTQPYPTYSPNKQDKNTLLIGGGILIFGALLFALKKGR